MTGPELPLQIDDIHAAGRRISGRVHNTPLITSRSVSERCNPPVKLKCENLQKGGSFKIRGALNAILELDPQERGRGVVAFSSGNHAQGVALAARMLGIPATVVMPEGSVAAKVEATLNYGAVVVQEGVTQLNREQVAREIAERTGATIIPPFDHPHIIAGAGTAALEIIREWADLECVVVPLGGGGLLAGTAVALKQSKPSIRVIGVEPAAGNDGQQSLARGEIVTIQPPDTIADGARTTALGIHNFAIIRELVDEIVTVDDDELFETLIFAVYRTKLLMEPTAVLGLAAALNRKMELPGPTAVIISGGNVDLPIFGR
jgi:threo-3-hydroxy-L-aspartate ammonia-lyase